MTCWACPLRGYDDVAGGVARVAEIPCVDCGVIRRANLWPDGTPKSERCKSCAQRHLRPRGRLVGRAEKKCGKCRHILNSSEFSSNPSKCDGLNGECRPCVNAARRARHTVSRGREDQLRRYGLSVAAYDALLDSQGGACAICGRTKSDDTRGYRLAVDHNHETGAVRGLLCGYCNRAIGLMRDDPELLEKAAQYLRVAE